MTETWHQVTVRVPAETPTRDGAAAEQFAAAALGIVGADGVAIADADTPGFVDVTAYYPGARDFAEINTQLSTLLNEFEITHKVVKPSDWSDNWKQYYQPARLTRFLTVIPSWNTDYRLSSREIAILLDPDSAFGTGTHPTTVMALYALEQTLRGGETVIDIGTGSGVLAVAAAKLGAQKVIATDISDDAVAIARANVELNAQGAAVQVQANNLLTGITTKVEVIVANILAEVLVQLIDDAAALLKPNGHVILSGIYHDKVNLISAQVLNAGLTITTQTTQGDWYSLIAAKES